MTSEILYTSYASNMSWEALVGGYIRGGTRPGSSTPEIGCRDASDPSRRIIFASGDHQLYFTQKSSRYGSAPYSSDPGQAGGMAAVDARHRETRQSPRIIEPSLVTLQELIDNDETVFVGWEITREQFEDIMAQEKQGLEVGKFQLPQQMYELLTLENPTLDLRKRVGENAIAFPDGTSYEIDLEGSYSALMLVDEIELDGEMIKAITFTSPQHYERVAAQTYINMATANAPRSSQDEVVEKATSRINEVYGCDPYVKLARLNPAAISYVEVIVGALVEIGEGNKGWDRESALNYVLSKPPFHEFQLPGFAEQVQEFFIQQNTSNPELHTGVVR